VPTRLVTRHTVPARERLAWISTAMHAHQPRLQGLALVCTRDILGGQVHATSPGVIKHPVWPRNHYREAGRDSSGTSIVPKEG
jgi:hypothetical protein